MAPFLLVLVEALLPYPAVVEEVTKWLLIGWWLRNTKAQKSDWIYPAAAGLVFAVNESILYINKIILSGEWWIFPERLVLTIVLHSVTMVLMFMGLKQGKTFGYLTLLAAVLIHWGFNNWVMSF